MDVQNPDKRTLDPFFLRLPGIFKTRERPLNLAESKNSTLNEELLSLGGTVLLTVDVSRIAWSICWARSTV